MSNYALTYLATLVMKKNELNRKRRRFLALATASPIYGRDDMGRHYCAEASPHKSFSFAHAEVMYQHVKSEMKAMTKHMREVRKSTNAKLRWNNSGGIYAITLGEQYFYAKDIVRLADDHLVDNIILS